MNKNEMAKTLKKGIQDIYSIINEFEKTGQIHPIDIDLALSKVRNLYDLMLTLHQQPSYNTEYQQKEILTNTKQEEKIITKPVTEEVIKEPVKKEEPVTKPEVKENFITEKIEIKEEETLVKETPKTEKPKKEIIEEKPIVTQEKTNGSNPEILADKFQSKKFVHDNISKKSQKKDVSAKMQSKPITDISTAIGLNDKFIFIRELFGGDKDQYQETIQLLNNFDTYENAINFLEENFDWSAEDPNFERLKELVQRKYPN